MKFVQDTLALFDRLMKHIMRSPDTIITVALMPIAMMLMFVYVFGGAVMTSLDPSVNYVNYQLPGVLLMAIASGISYTSYRLFLDMQKGLFARFNSMPISRSAVLWSHVLTSLASTALTLLVIFGVALMMGFRSGAGIGSWLAVAGILLLYTLALTWVAMASGISAKSMEGASAFAYPLLFLPFLSSAFVPTETMPKAVRAFAENQPVTSIVNSIRALLDRQPVGSQIWVALAWMVGISLVGYLFTLRAYRRKV